MWGSQFMITILILTLFSFCTIKWVAHRIVWPRLILTSVTRRLTRMTSYLRHDITHLMSPGYLLPHVTLANLGTNTYVNLFLYLCESFPYNKYVFLYTNFSCFLGYIDSKLTACRYQWAWFMNLISNLCLNLCSKVVSGCQSLRNKVGHPQH